MRRVRLLAGPLLASALLGACSRGAETPATAGASPRAGVAELIVSYRLDPALTRGVYMGERWVSPRVYTSTLQEGREARVAARAEGRDERRHTVRVSPTWLPDDPGMVSVSPARGSEVTIIVKRPGRSLLRLRTAEAARTLAIEALHRDRTTRVRISDEGPGS